MRKNTKENALYVGQTGRIIKARQHDVTSPHNKKSWWKDWTHLRSINIKVKDDLQFLEFLRIVALAPTCNKSAKSKCLDDFLRISQFMTITRIEPKKKLSLFEWKEILEYRDLLYFLAMRDIQLRYKQTALGVVLVVLQPLH